MLFRKIKNNIGVNEAQTEDVKAIDEIENEVDKEVSSKKKSDKKEKIKKDDTYVPIVEKSSFDWLKSKGQLAVDVFQTENEFCVQAPIAGVEQNDIDITIENEMLIIRGERREPMMSAKEKKYSYQECYWGPFSRQVIIPEDINKEKIKASLKAGILVIRMPKAEPHKKKIVVEIE